MARRILLLGTTGVSKENVVKKLEEYLRARRDIPNFVSLDFERQYIESPRRKLYNYLDDPEDRQRSLWREAWVRCNREIQSIQDKDVILAIHGVLVRPLFGTRSPVYIDDLKQFQPTAIVTLIDDVYTKWYRTEDRARGRTYVGRPTLAQLLDARRAEIFLGDVLATNIAPADVPLQNYVVAIRHPARVLDRLLFRPHVPKTVYLSFPISGPRRLARQGDKSGIAEVNAFLTRACEVERSDLNTVFFCPLTIDELPLIATLDQHHTDQDTIEFHMNERWDIEEFYGAEILLTNPDSIPEILKLPRQYVQDAVPFIRTDVATRDYRLVLQSRSLIVFNPWFQGEQSRGVDSEIDCALHHGIPVHIFQDSLHDPEGVARKTLKGGESGALGGRPTDDYINFYNRVVP
jgi:adenylate kinase